MKVIILAGGYGTRLGSITEEMPKPMVRIGDKPIIWHIMKIYSNYGYKDFIIALGYKQEMLKEYFYKYDVGSDDYTINLGSKKIDKLKEHNEKDWNVSLIDTGLHTLKGGRIKRLEKYLDADDIHMLTYGDGVADIDIKKLVKFHKSHGKMVTITGVRPPSRFGELLEKKGKLIVFNKKLLEYLTEDENCDLEYGVFEKLAKKGQIMVYKHTGKWECVDTDRDLKHLNKIWNEGKAFWKNSK